MAYGTASSLSELQRHVQLTGQSEGAHPNGPQLGHALESLDKSAASLLEQCSRLCEVLEIPPKAEGQRDQAPQPPDASIVDRLVRRLQEVEHRIDCAVVQLRDVNDQVARLR